MTDADTPQKPTVTVVTCIESGALEDEVPLMVASLRRFGGELADCPVIAVSPRFAGLPLLKETRRKLDALGVELIQQNYHHRYAWWGFMNKPTTLMLAAPRIKTSHALWLDGDILIARPPDDLLRYPDTQILAAVEEMGTVSTGVGDPFDTFWGRLAEIIDVPLGEFPWVTRPFTRSKIRIYFNSGVFRYPMGVGLEQAYLQTVEQVLDAQIVARNDPSIFLFEQISFGLAVARLGLKFHELDDTLNFQVEECYEQFCAPDRYPDVSVFHYHRALRGPYRPKLLALLHGTHPELARMVEAAEPAPRTGLMKYRVIPRKLLYEFRRKRMGRFNDRCVRV